MSEDLINRLWNKLDSIEKKLDDKIIDFENRITETRAKYDNIKWLLGGTVVVLLGKLIVDLTK